MGVDRLGIHQRERSYISGYDTSDVVAVGSSYSFGCYIRILVASGFPEFMLRVSVCSVSSAFSDRGTAFKQPQCVCYKLYVAAVSAHSRPIVFEVAGSVISN